MRALWLGIAAVVVVGCGNPELEQKVTTLTEEKAQLEKQLQSLKGENARLQRQLERARKLSDRKKAEKVEAKEVSPDDLKKIREGLGLQEGQKLFATFKTSMGDMVAELHVDKTPITVENFVRLAEGTKEWTTPSGEKVKKPLYKGTKFHRVIPKFMVQGGDPKGNGSGGPGYQFQDEFHPDLKHDKPGILSMANRGPGTNGSQFFITEVPTKHLDNRHTVFGEVIENVQLVAKMTGVEKMSSSPRDSRPKVDIILKDVVIGRGAPKK
jgi:cyclophilin family peptidyl-prolyl cis-trans isomerase